MHYPIGTDICVTNQRPRPAGGIRSITDARTAGFTNKTPFVTNAKYSLYNIRIMENKVLYEFIMIGGQSIDDNIFLEFTNADGSSFYPDPNHLYRRCLYCQPS